MIRTKYTIDAQNPRAPSQQEWDLMTREEQLEVVANLPSEFPPEAGFVPEGDPHFNAKVSAKDALSGYFARIRRRVYLACELPIYYPAEPMFAPDLMAVLDVSLHSRMSWVVSDEKKGLDFALEVHVAGDRRKDLVRNAEKYARLGIAEYFIFDRGRLHLTGYRLPSGGAKVYQPILPQAGRYECAILGLELAVIDSRLRFFAGTAELPEAVEMLGKLEGLVDQLEQRLQASEERAEEESRRAQEESQRAQEESRRAQEESRRAQEVERRLAEALSELERLKR